MKAIIYKIENTKTLDCYIGSTTNYNRRKHRHFEDLKHNQHHSIILQRAYNKNGENCFKITIIKRVNCVNKQELLSIEQIYLDSLQPKYNICKIADSQLGSKRSKKFKKECSNRMKGKPAWNKGLKVGKQSKDTCKKRSKSLMGHKVSPKTKDLIKEKVSRPVIQFDSNGNFIKEWESPKQASKELKFSYTCLITYLNGHSNINTFKNFIWKRKK